MSEFFRTEPMLGCQMAGILKGVAGIDRVVPIVHGPMGCASGHRIIPLFAGREPLVTTTALTEMDTIMGAEDRLRKAILQAGKIYHPDLIVVILSCATSLTGEVHHTMTESLQQQVGCPILVLDGSGIVGNEIDGYRAFYEAFRRLEANQFLECEGNAGLELTGLSTADFGCREDVLVIQDLLNEAAGIGFNRVLFHDVSLSASQPYHSIHAGRLWLEDDIPCPAPFGAQGTLAWVEHVCGSLGQPLRAAFHRQIADLQSQIQGCCTKMKDLRIGIEAESWWGIGLARFFSEEFGCAVCLSSDQGAVQYQQRFGAVATTFEDTSNVELVNLFQSFRADLVFGSSYTFHEDWFWVPFWHPVWHVVDDQNRFMGISGAYRLLALLKDLENQRNVPKQMHFK